MPTLREVLADKTNYQDNLAWTLGNGVTVTLAQLRGLSAEDQSAITKKEAELTTARTNLETRESELKRAQANTGTLYTTLQSALEALKAGRVNDPAVKQLFGDVIPPVNGGNNNTNDPFAALSRLEQDTLMGPVVQVIKLVRDEAKKAQDAVAQNINVQKAMAENYLNGTLEDRYDRYVPVDKQDKFPLSKLIQDAVQAKHFTSDSTPDIKWAYKNLTAGDDAAAKEAAARADERKKVEAEFAARGTGGVDANGIFVPTPQNFGLDVHNRTGKAPQPYKTLDDAFAAAAKDSSIWENVDKTIQ